MKKLKNWDNSTWLSSKKYINFFCRFITSKIRINKKTKILDIGCGRGNIISQLQYNYKFNQKVIGLDIIKNSDIKKNINFIKTDAIKYLNKTNKEFDIILIKQTIHFFSKKKIKTLLNLAKKKLKKKGKILIFSIEEKGNEIPVFKRMEKSLNKSLKKNKVIFKEIKKNFKKIDINYFNYQVVITRYNYLNMIKKRYISCLLGLTNKELNKGIEEIKTTYKKKLIFFDRLICISNKN